MGKSPGRWIKKVLLGKKSSKTLMANGREKTANHKEGLFTTNATEDDMFSAPCVISNPIPITSSLSERNLEIENSDSVDSQNNGGMSFKENQDANSVVSTPLLASSDEKKLRQEEPATFAQDNQSTANQKEVVVTSRETEEDPLPPMISNPIPSERHLELENHDIVDLQNNGGMSLQRNQDANSKVLIPQLALLNEEKIRQEEAATFVQAAFKGYRARRAFQALKGIIRLQALIRGHLVRRQAVATLYCIQGIVKLQALSRGIKVRNSDIGQEISKKHIVVKPPDGKLGDMKGGNVPINKARLSENVFILKLVASSPKVMPLCLYYDSVEPNSVQSWLERWTVSNFWKPIPQPKRNPNLKSERRQNNGQMVEAETGRPKSTVQRVPASNIDNTSVKTAFDWEKPKHNFRKYPSHVAETVQENPQNELEKVKRNLRKVRKDVTENAAQAEFEVEKSNDSLEKVSDNLLVKSMTNSGEKMKKEVLIQNMNNSGEKMNKEITSPTQKQPDLPVKNAEFPDTETTIDPLIVTGVSKTHSNQAMDIQNLKLKIAGKMRIFQQRIKS